jgi:hypothetical protein
LDNAVNKLHTHTHTHTHTETIRVHSEKPFKTITSGLSVDWWMMHLIFMSLPLWNRIFVTHPLTSVVAVSWKSSTSLIPGGVSHTFTPFPKLERPSFTPDRVTWGSLGGDQYPAPSASQRQAYYLNLSSYQSDGWSSKLVPDPSSGSFVQLRLALWHTRRGDPPSGQQVCGCLVGYSPD